MKKTFIIIMAAVLGFMAACKKEDKVTVAANVTGPTLIAPVTATAVIVTATDSTQAFKFKWSKANYGVSAVVNYFVQVDSAGRSFKKNITIGTSNADTLVMTLGALNSKLLAGLNVAANGLASLEVRAGSAIYGKDTVYSAPIKLSFTSFKVLAPDRLWVPGAYQGWDPSVALTIPAVTTYTYEGYINMAIADYFKFTTAADWSHINYGDGGGGKLSTDGNAAGLQITSAGYYKLNVDIKSLSYTAVKISSFGIIGTATPQQWNASTPMTFDAARKVWKITIALAPGALKFRANDAWDINYGPADTNALTGTLIQTNDAITIAVAGNYTVTLDMSQSSQKKYLYTVVKN